MVKLPDREDLESYIENQINTSIEIGSVVRKPMAKITFNSYVDISKKILSTLTFTE